MYLKDMTPGHTYTMGFATFTVEAVRYEPGMPCAVTAVMGDGTRTMFHRAALTTVVPQV